MQQPKIAVVGGSLVGPAAELFLRREGFTDVTTYEAAPRLRSQSGGIMGVRYPALATLDLIGVTQDRIAAMPHSDVHAFGASGESLGSSVFPGVVASWDALHRELAERVDVQHGHKILSVEATDGRQALTCACGQTHEADRILWADGRKSLGRTLIDPDRPLKYNGYVVWRGLAEPPTPTPRGHHNYRDVVGGRMFSVTEPTIQSDKSYWEFAHNLPRDEWIRLSGAPPEQHPYMLPRQVGADAQDLIRSYAQGLPPHLPALIGEVSGIAVNDVPMPCRALTRFDGGSWSALLGDALVPVRPQAAAGLNQGLRQAADLATAMTSTSVGCALSRWEQGTLDSLARVVEQGRSRAHRNNLGWYLPVRPGKTTAPVDDQWADPQWVTA